MSIPKSRMTVTVNKKTKNKVRKAVEKRRLTAQERAEFARRRRLLEGSLITQRDVFEGAMVIQHIRGSQYLVRLSSGEEVYASHKRQKDAGYTSADNHTGFSHGGWSIWT